MRGLIRPLRFLIASLPLFLVWQVGVRDAYLEALAQLFVATARTATLDVRVADVGGGSIHFEYGDVAWTDQFGLTSLNLVAYAALVAATGRITWGRRLGMLSAGLAMLVGTQILGLWSDIAHVHLREEHRALADGLRAFWTGFGTFLFPVLVWLVLVRDLLPLPAAPRSRRT